MYPLKSVLLGLGMLYLLYLSNGKVINYEFILTLFFYVLLFAFIYCIAKIMCNDIAEKVSDVKYQVCAYGSNIGDKIDEKIDKLDWKIDEKLDKLDWEIDEKLEELNVKLDKHITYGGIEKDLEEDNDICFKLSNIHKRMQRIDYILNAEHVIKGGKGKKMIDDIDTERNYIEESFDIIYDNLDKHKTYGEIGKALKDDDIVFELNKIDKRIKCIEDILYKVQGIVMIDDIDDYMDNINETLKVIKEDIEDDEYQKYLFTLKNEEDNVDKKSKSEN